MAKQDDALAAITAHLATNQGGHRKPTLTLPGCDTATALCIAASVGDLTTVKRIVGAGGDTDEGDYDDRTALHLAASEGHAGVVKFLIDAGANVNVLDRFGRDRGITHTIQG